MEFRVHALALSLLVSLVLAPPLERAQAADDPCRSSLATRFKTALRNELHDQFNPERRAELRATEETALGPKIPFDLRARARDFTESQKTFWQEVWKTRGVRAAQAIRDEARWAGENLILRPAKNWAYEMRRNPIRRACLYERQPRFQTNYLSLAQDASTAYLAPWAPILGGVAELTRSKYGVALGCDFLISQTIGQGYYRFLDEKEQKETYDELEPMLQKAQKYTGVPYAKAFLDLGLIDPVTLKEAIRQHRGALEAWHSRSSRREPLPRIRQLHELGVLKNREEIQALDQLAYGIRKKILCDFSPKCDTLPDDFNRRLALELEASIDQYPLLKGKSPEEKRLMRMLFDPTLMVGDRTDIDVMAEILGVRKSRTAESKLASLQPYAEELNPPELAYLAYRGTPSRIEEKRKLWAEFEPTVETPAFAQRADFPRATGPAFDQDGSGKRPLEFAQELDVWKLVWRDPRFSDLKSRYQQGQESQIRTLESAQERILAYNDIFARARQKDWEPLLCAWLGQTDSASENPLVADPVKALLENPTFQKRASSLSERELQACALDLADGVFRYRASEAGIKSPQDIEKQNARFEPYFQQILLNCPKPSSKTGALRTCP